MARTEKKLSGVRHSFTWDFEMSLGHERIPVANREQEEDLYPRMASVFMIISISRNTFTLSLGK
jgi:hypothetical protein